MFGGYGALGRHACMPQRVRAVQFVQFELPDKLTRQSFFLVNLDRGTRAHDLQLGMYCFEPALYGRHLHRSNDHGMAGMNFQFDVGLQMRGHLGLQCIPVVIAGNVQCQLAARIRNGVAVKCDAGTVRTAIAHLNKHGRQKRAELRIQVLILEINADDAAHDLSCCASANVNRSVHPCILLLKLFSCHEYCAKRPGPHAGRRKCP